MASARLMPIALTLMRTSFGPGAGTWTSTNSRTSGPPAFANLIVRDMAVSVKSDRGSCDLTRAAVSSELAAVMCRHREGQYSSRWLCHCRRQNQPSLAQVGRSDLYYPWMRSADQRRSHRVANPIRPYP